VPLIAYMCFNIRQNSLTGECKMLMKPERGLAYGGEGWGRTGRFWTRSCLIEFGKSWLNSSLIICFVLFCFSFIFVVRDAISERDRKLLNGKGYCFALILSVFVSLAVSQSQISYLDNLLNCIRGRVSATVSGSRLTSGVKRPDVIVRVITQRFRGRVPWRT